MYWLTQNTKRYLKRCCRTHPISLATLYLKLSISPWKWFISSLRSLSLIELLQPSISNSPSLHGSDLFPRFALYPELSSLFPTLISWSPILEFWILSLWLACLLNVHHGFNSLVRILDNEIWSNPSILLSLKWNLSMELLIFS